MLQVFLRDDGVWSSDANFEDTSGSQLFAIDRALSLLLVRLLLFFARTFMIIMITTTISIMIIATSIMSIMINVIF